MKLVFEGSKEMGAGVWLTSVPPHQLAKMEPTKVARGSRSVLLATSPTAEGASLVLDADGLSVLNLGTTPVTLVIDAGYGARIAEEQPLERGDLGPGDREYMSLVERELSGEAQEVAVDLLREIRLESPGDLKRGERNNFSNTPDNFWYVIVQPRVQALSITVRGAPERFRPSSLELRIDRPGYTRFQLHEGSELAEALRIIRLSKRK
jgi:hypothetical protein